MSTPIRPLSGTEFPPPAALTDERVDRLLPAAEDRSKLEGAAEAVGATLGRAVSTVRDLPRRFTVIRGGASSKASDVMEEASAKLDDLKSQAREHAEELGSQVRSRAELLGSQVRDRAEILGSQVRGGITSARIQVRHYIQEYPLQCLGGVFGAAFLAGITLRIWRTRD